MTPAGRLVAAAALALAATGIHAQAPNPPQVAATPPEARAVSSAPTPGSEREVIDSALKLAGMAKLALSRTLMPIGGRFALVLLEA